MIKSVFWENVRNFLILESGSSISWSMKNFSSLDLKSVPGSPRVYYWQRTVFWKTFSKKHRKITAMGLFFSEAAGCDVTEESTSQ